MEEKIKHWEEQIKNITANIEKIDNYLRKVDVTITKLRLRQIQRYKLLKHLKRKVEEARKGVQNGNAN